MKGLNHPAVRVITRRFWGTVFTLIIAFAVLVQLGRQAFPLIQDYQEDIIRIVERSLEVKIAVKKLEASWSGLRPKITLEKVYVSSMDDVAIFKVDSVTAELSLINSITSRRFSWRQLLFAGFDARMVQSVDGRWAISGMENFKSKKSGKENFKFDDPYDLFLFGRRIVITDANFHLHYQSGERSTATIPTISIENDRDFHRLVANIDINEGHRIFSLIVEGDGDPRDEHFVANGYLELNRFSTQNIIETLALSEIELGSAGHTTDMKLWFRSDHQKGTTIRGSVHTQGQVRHKKFNLELPEAISANFHGKAGRSDGWRLTMQDFLLAWPDLQSPNATIGFFGDFRGIDGVRVGELDLEKWMKVVDKVGIENKGVSEALSTLNPKGSLKNVNIKLVPKASGYFHAEAEVDDVSTDAYMGAPAFQHVNGYINFSAFEGYANVNSNDGFVLDLPKVYHDPMVFDVAQGQVRWKIDLDKHAAYLSSGVITVAAGDERASGYLNMALPFAKKYGEQEMTLVLGLEQASALSHKKYVPKTIPSHLYDWLNKSIKGGEVSDVSFLYHGSIQKDPDIQPSIQLAGSVKNGKLEFDEHWPPLEALTGNIVVDDDHVDVDVAQAQIKENNIFNATLKLIDNPRDVGRALLIKGESASDVNRAMALINDSPLRKNIGDTFDDWVMRGDVTATLKLVVPLEKDVKGESQTVDVEIKNADVDITSLDLNYKNVRGDLHYYSDKGLFSKGLKGTLWGKAVNAELSNPTNTYGSRDILLDFSGEVDVASLNAWLKRPELDFSDGTTSVSGTFKVPGENSPDVMTLSTRSNLKGVNIDLPAPFGKKKEDASYFSAEHKFFNNADEIRIALGKQLDVAILLPHETKPETAETLAVQGESSESVVVEGEAAALEKNAGEIVARDQKQAGAQDEISVYVHLNQRDIHQQLPSPVPSTQRFQIDGSLDAVAFEQWLEVKDKYFQFSEKYSEGEASEDDSLSVIFNSDIGMFTLGGVEIENLSVTGERKNAVWDINAASKILAGNILVPEDENPISMDLNYLRLTSEEEATVDGEEQGKEKSKEKDQDSEDEDVPYESVLAEVDLKQAIPLLFSTKEFSVDEDNYGAWSFMLTPINDGIELFNIVASSRGLQIGQSGESASLVWTQKEGEQSTQFKGDIFSSDLARVFEAWGYEKLVYSKSANFSVNAHWPGAPDEVSLKSIEGLFSLDMKNGSFSRGAESDENAFLRLIALFNFDTILRRLRLDFSDLAAQGYAFDNVTGKFDFRDGKVFLTDPLKVKSSSSNLQLAGIIGMVEEDVDAEIVVTLPVASNVALATALVVNLPAALGVYVMSKLFKKQLDKASSLTVELNGSWDDPKVKIKKIFDTEGANKKGQQIKDENFTPPSEQPLEEK